MNAKNQAINSYLRKQRFRKVLVFVIVTVLFLGFMSYALYMEYGDETEIVNYLGGK